MDVRDKRLAKNQELFRSANERLRERVQELDAVSGLIPFLCECADEACLGRVDLEPSQYRDVRSRPNHYVVLPGHPRIEGERIVEDLGDFQIVEKGSGEW